MFRFASLAAIGLATAGLTLATPSTSHAQVGVGVRVGPIGVSAGLPIYPPAPYPVYVPPPRVVVQPGYPVYAYPPPPVVTYPVAPSVVVRAPFYYPHWHRHYRHR